VSPPPPPIDPESIPKELKDGIVASVLGGLAMTARLLLSTEPVSLGWVVRRVLAAAITAALVGYAIAEHIQSPGLRMGAIGAIGYCAPEALDYLLKAFKARAEKEVGAIAGKVKPNGKSKSSKAGKRKR
jgi:phage shock protein PspC (stress-responsive transcriptional regulator)